MGRMLTAVFMLGVGMCWQDDAKAQTQPRLAYAEGGRLRLMVSNKGSFGTAFVARTTPSMEWPARSGIDHLVRGGLWVGAVSAATGDSLVTIGARDAYYTDPVFQNSEFTPVTGIHSSSRIPSSPNFALEAVSDQDLEAVYVDTLPIIKPIGEQAHRPMGITVIQHSYTWGCEPLDDVALLQFDIVNVGHAALQDLYVGIYTELATNDRSAFVAWPPGARWFDYQDLQWDPVQRLLWNHNVEHRFVDDQIRAGLEVVGCGGHGPYGRGPDSLSTKRLSLSAWQWSPSRFSSWGDDSLYARMSTGQIANVDSLFDPGTTDHPVSVLSLGPFALLAPGDTLQAVFAFVAGSDLEDLRINAQRARHTYETLYELPLCPQTDIEVEDLTAATVGGRARLAWRLSRDARERLAGIGVERARIASGPYETCTSAGLVPAATMSYTDPAPWAASTAWYRLALLGRDGSRSTAGPIRLELAASGNSRTQLRAPMDPGAGAPVQVGFHVGLDRSSIRLEIFDVRGRRVRAFSYGQCPAGEHTQTWNRSDQQNVRVGRGIYVIRLTAEDAIDSRKLVLLGG